MRLNKLHLKNFRGFTERSFDLNPHFNLIIGENGSGKSTLFHAGVVALDGLVMFLDESKDRRSITEADVRRESKEHGIGWSDIHSYNIEPQYPCRIEASGTFLSENQYTWHNERDPQGPVDDQEGRPWAELGTMRGIRQEGKELREKVQSFAAVNMPLLAAYGAERLWLEPIESLEPAEGEALRLSRYEGYRDCLHGRASKRDLNWWIFKQNLQAMQKTIDGWSLDLLGAAIIGVLPGGKHVGFDAQHTQTTIIFDDGQAVLLDDLSDGQRTMVTLVGDIARRAITLNPHLKAQALKQTEGVVLIDELDLHLHPKWQRRVIDDLRKTFPKIQFICTTHAPLLIQSLTAREIISLDHALPPDWEGENSVEDILEEVQGVAVPQRSRKSQLCGEAAQRYFTLVKANGEVDPVVLAQAELEYREASAPFADNQAVNAILKLEAISAVQRGGNH